MLSISLAYVFAYVDWMALSLIALSRALSVCAPQFLNKTTSNLKSKVAIAFVWLFVILVMTPSFLEVKISFKTKIENSSISDINFIKSIKTFLYFQESVMFGYNCARGKCDLFKTGRTSRLGWIGEQVNVLAIQILF